VRNLQQHAHGSLFFNPQNDATLMFATHFHDSLVFDRQIGPFLMHETHKILHHDHLVSSPQSCDIGTSLEAVTTEFRMSLSTFSSVTLNVSPSTPQPL
jgi:hypothetical protein